jgi:hypothetical protein
MIEQGGDAIEGPWDGEEGITLYPDWRQVPPAR